MHHAQSHADPLLRPLTIGHLTLKNRVMSTSHACGLQEGGMPKERYQRYHEEKARGGLALTMFGGSSNVAVDLPNVFSQLNVGTDAVIPWSAAIFRPHPRARCRADVPDHPPWPARRILCE